MIRPSPRMWIVIYAAALALGAFALEWTEYKYLTRTFSLEIYILILVTAFTALGIWVGHKLSNKPAAADFAQNDKAIQSLGLTRREMTILELLAAGKSNKVIARDLGISPNTVKTHTANLFSKLEASGRMDAVNIARSLQILP